MIKGRQIEWRITRERNKKLKAIKGGDEKEEWMKARTRKREIDR